VPIDRVADVEATDVAAPDVAAIAQTPTRRQVLAAGAVVVGSVALVGCGSSSASTGGGAGSGGASAGLIKLASVPVGGSASATSGGQPAVVSQPTSGNVVAFSAICTHMGCTVAPAGSQFHCPCHGSVYDAFTGKVLSGPAPAPLPSIAVKVVGDEVIEA
jgi:cytochrome b6-f complex iron-sulfur subunit